MVSVADKTLHPPAPHPSSYVPPWDAEAVSSAWESYTEPLLRKVAGLALKPRQKQPAAELRAKLLDWHHNPPQVDRRLREVSPPARTLLALLHLGKRSQRRVGTLLEMVSCLQQSDGQP